VPPAGGATSIPLSTVRQLFTWRFVAAIAALAALAFLLNAIVVDDDSLDAVVQPEVPDRRIDLVSPIFSIERSDNFRITPRGVTRGYMDVVLGEQRIMRVTPGTRGEITCEQLDAVNECALFADMLGDAVIWFAILPQGPRATAELPAIVDLEDGLALFENGWQLPYPPVIERSCRDEDIPSFSDFLARFGKGSITTVDLVTGEVLSTRCAGDAAPTIPTTTLAPDLGTETPDQAPTSAPTSVP
jgi:hypothetical protein